MSSIFIKNALLVTLDQEAGIIPNGALFIEGDEIRAIGRLAPAEYPADRVIDAEGQPVMPGFVNIHHHLYSTLARGFSPPGEPAANFKEILERLWWKLDYVLNEEDVYASAVIALLDGIRAGCTTVIDHHASPSCTAGSLDIIERAFLDAGLNGCLCYEVSDRNREGDGVDENERFLKKCAARETDQIKPLLGLHAPMTVGNRSMERCAEIAREYDVGFHVHVAESEFDAQITKRDFGAGLIDRLEAYGVLSPKSLIAHCIHLRDDEIRRVAASGAMVVNNPESNMNNGLAVAPVLKMLNSGILAGLGTDGMSSNILSQARAFYMIQRATQRDPRVGFVEACAMLLENNRAIANRVFGGRSRGVLRVGALADVIILDYQPFTPFDENTFMGHVLFGLAYAPVTTTICRGRLLMEHGAIGIMDERSIRAGCLERSNRLWSRFKDLQLTYE